MDIFRNVSQPVGDQIRNYINENPHIVDESAESNNDWTLANILPLVGIAGGLFKVPTHGQDLKLRAAREEFTRRFGKDWAPIDELRQVNKRRQDTARGFENLSKKACYHDYKLEQLVCEASYFGDDLDACLDLADSNYEN